MKFSLNIFLFLVVFNVFSQEKKPVSPIIAVDSLYREDQFYLLFTYNSLFNRPTGISENKFSSSFATGFLRDIPINKNRTIAIASGLGISYSRCFQNLYIQQINQEITYSAIPSGMVYSKNKLDQFYVDVPLELRWRTSTAESHKFWRIYSGFKFSYLVWDRYTHIDNESNFRITRNDDLNKFQVGTYLAFGYNTWNFYGYYGLTPFFKSSARINNEPVGLNTLNLGLIFYIL